MGIHMSDRLAPVSSERWSSRAGFIFAAMGSAIGLCSIWKFPYEAGTNGGGGFVIFYLLGLGLIVFPLMLVEFAIGRRGRSHAVGSITAVAIASGASRLWAVIGVVGVVGAVLILSFYSVIGGWALAYVVDTIRDGLPGISAPAIQARFDALLESSLRMTVYHTLFMAATAVVVARGIAGGIERVSLYLMPILIVLVVVLASYSTIQGDTSAALRFLFAFDVERLSPRVALEALGLGFFSIGVGLAVMITYAAYAATEFDLRSVAIVTLLSDTAISFLAGMAVFPIVFAERLDPASGPGLMFVTLPLAFARMPLGAPAAIAFFVLLTLAALASALSLLEMPVSLAHRWLGWSRPRATLASAVGCWGSALPPCCLSAPGLPGIHWRESLVSPPRPRSSPWITCHPTCSCRLVASASQSSGAGSSSPMRSPGSLDSAQAPSAGSHSSCATSPQSELSRPASSRSCCVEATVSCHLTTPPEVSVPGGHRERGRSALAPQRAGGPAAGGMRTRHHMFSTKRAVPASWPSPPSAMSHRRPSAPATATLISAAARSAVEIAITQ